MDFEKINQFKEQQAKDAETAKQDSQHQEVTSSLNNLLLATMVSKDPKMVEVAQKLSELLSSIGDASQAFQGSALHLLPYANQELAASIQDFADKVQQYSPQDLEPYFQTLTRQLNMIAGTKPVVNVPKQPVTVDLKPLLSALKDVQKEVKANKIDIPANDMSDVIKGLKQVEKTIAGLSFPVPNYVLPFKDSTGKATQVQLDSSGNLPVSATITTGDIEIGAVELKNGTDDTRATITASNALKVDGSGVTQPVSGTVTITPSGTQDVNNKQVNGTTVDTNSGVKSAGTQRVVLATDQPQLTNALKVDGSATTQPVSGTFWQATQPISGTVTANAGTNLNTSTLALETGGNLATTATNTGTIGTNTTNIPNVIGTAASAVPSKLLQVGGSDGTNARAIKTNSSGQIDVRPLTTSDTVTVNNSTASNLKIDLSGTAANATAIKVDNSAVTQPISAASLPLPSLAATSTKQSDGSQKTQIVDGSGNVIGATTNALDVNIKSGSSSGTQYDELSTTDPGTGNLSLGRYNATPPSLTDKQMSSLQVDSAGALKVSGSLSVGGTTDNSAYTAGTSTGTPAMGFYHSTLDTVTDGRSATLAIDSKRSLHSTIRDAAGNARGANVNASNQLSVSVDNTVTVGSHAVTNAGTFAVQVDGSALTSLQLIDDPVATLGTTTYTEASTKGNIIGAVRRDANTTLVDTTNEIAPLQVNATGELKVAQIQALPAGTNAIGKLAANDGVDVGDVTINNASGASAVNIQDGGNSITVDNGGTFAVQASVAAGATNIAKAEDVASADADVGVPAMAVRKATPANTSGTDGDYEMLQMSAGRLWTSSTIDAALPAGTNAIGKLAANSGVIIGDVNVVNSNVSTNLAQVNGVTTLAGNGVSGTGAQRVTIASDSTGQVAVAASATATGTSINSQTAFTNTKVAVKASAGNLYGYHIYNPNSTVVYVQIFNVASASVTLGTTTPTMVLAIPPLGWADSPTTAPGIAFSTAITVAATTTSTGSTAPTSNLLANFWYL